MNYDEALDKLNKLPRDAAIHSTVRTVGDAISFIEFLRETKGADGVVFTSIADEIERLTKEFNKEV